MVSLGSIDESNESARNDRPKEFPRILISIDNSLNPKLAAVAASELDHGWTQVLQTIDVGIEIQSLQFKPAIKEKKLKMLAHLFDDFES